MKTDQIVKSLLSLSGRNEGLSLLYQEEKLPCNDLIEALVVVIREPQTIKDTNSFANLLTGINHDAFIPTLIATVSKDKSAASDWLADYLYALINLLEELNDYYPVDEGFINLLANWMFNTESGEISWKASNVLSEVENSASRAIFMKGAVDKSLLHLTRINCLRGVMNHYREDAKSLLLILINDEDEAVKNAAMDAQAFLNQT